jgi:hypothetical protein
MCTIAFIARRHGYVLGMNRDEKKTRVVALPALRQRMGDRTALFPSEPNGGTWIGVNDSGTTLALINWYSVPAQAPGTATSRGEVVKSCLPAAASAEVERILTGLPLARLNAFRLIGVFPKTKGIVEWLWDQRELRSSAFPWRTNLWVSSGYDEPGAQQIRGRYFAEVLHQRSAGTLSWLRRFQSSHRPERGPFSVCMHREDAATVSSTEIGVSRSSATLRYTPGAPCCTAAQPGLHLELVKR